MAEVEVAPPTEAVGTTDVAGPTEAARPPSSNAGSATNGAANGSVKASESKAKEESSKGGPNKRPFKNGNKSNYEDLEESSDPVAIRKQVEFYFSDSNLAQDRFLFNKVGGPTNNSVPIATIHSFKRMRHFQPLSAVVAALKDSATLDVVDDDTALRRKVALAAPTEGAQTQAAVEKVYEDAAMARTVYAKGFGAERATTQFDIEAWFARYGPTNQVRLRRLGDRTFKGSVFVEFDAESTAKKFLEADPTPKFEGRELVVKSKKQYCDEKVADINAGKLRPNDKRARGGKHGGGKGKGDDRDWRERRDEDRKGGFQNKSGQGGRGGRGARGGRGGYGAERAKVQVGRGGGRGGKDDSKSTWSNTAQAGSSEPSKDGTDRADANSSGGSKKRSREDDDAADEAEGSPSAKKVQVEAVPEKSTEDRVAKAVEEIVAKAAGEVKVQAANDASGKPVEDRVAKAVDEFVAKAAADVKAQTAHDVSGKDRADAGLKEKGVSGQGTESKTTPDSKKRAREEDDVATKEGEPAVKKVDVEAAG